MMIMNKTPNGTICANRWENGIAMGIYGRENGISLEWDSKEKKFKLLIKDQWLKENGVEVKFVNEQWRESDV